MEKELRVRQRVLDVFNKNEEDFDTLDEWNDYLEETEDIIYNLANDIEVAQTEQKLAAYYKANQEDIAMRNARRLEEKRAQLEAQAAASNGGAPPSQREEQQQQQQQQGPDAAREGDKEGPAAAAAAAGYLPAAMGAEAAGLARGAPPAIMVQPVQQPQEGAQPSAGLRAGGAGAGAGCKGHIASDFTPDIPRRRAIAAAWNTLGL